MACVQARHDLPVVIGACPEGPWVKARAVADALRQTNAEILIIADADVWAPGLPEALEAVRAGAAWAMPHRGVLRLSEAATARFVAGDDWMGLCGDLFERAHRGVEGGGITVTRRDVYDACPLDPRFEGWGGEDESWSFALRTFYGAPVCSESPLIHLFHPPQQRATRTWGSLESRALRKRYARAHLSPPAMTALLEEAKHAQRAPEPPPHDHHAHGR